VSGLTARTSRAKATSVSPVTSALTQAVDRVCRDVIAPVALDVDQDVVPRSHLDALAATGLFAGATEDVSAADVRSAHERLAGTCLSTWFVVAQHQTPLRLVRAAAPHLRDPLLPLLESGATIGGVAFSHLRRWPQRPVDVERVAGGWHFSGSAPWYSGWGINDVAVIAGATSDGHVVHVLVPAEASAAVRPGPPVSTVALGAARTVPLYLDDLVVPDNGVLAIEHIEEWSHADERATANVSPGVIGVAQAAIDRLRDCYEPSAQVAGRRLGTKLARIRLEAYALIDEVDPHERITRRLQLRAQALRLGVDATTALVVSRAGRAMMLSDDAQMLARWALFLAVQAQTHALRSALLSSF